MGFKEYKLEEVSKNFNQQRIPLAGLVRKLVKGACARNYSDNKLQLHKTKP